MQSVHSGEQSIFGDTVFLSTYKTEDTMKRKLYWIAWLILVAALMAYPSPVY